MSVLKNKLKITQKQLLSTLIVIATLVTSITIPQNIAYADGNYSGTNTGGGNGSMSATSDYKAYSKTDSGYRFYIINNKLERVSNIVDITITTPTNVKYWEKSTRFDTANSPHGIKTYTKSAPEMKKLFGKYESSKEIYSGQPVLEWMPMPVFNENGVNKGAGKQFQSWFLKNVGVKQAQGGGNPTPIYKGGNGYIPGYNPTILTDPPKMVYRSTILPLLALLMQYPFLLHSNLLLVPEQWRCRIKIFLDFWLYFADFVIYYF